MRFFYHGHPDLPLVTFDVPQHNFFTRGRLTMFLLVFTVVLGFVVARYAHAAWSQRREERLLSAESARRGCGAVPVMKKKGFLGFGRLIESIQATNNGQGPQYVVKAINEEMGENIHTVVVPIHDYKLLVTRDPANVQAMLATQSVDWDVGKHRNESWRPLFGDGVFTSRGEEWRHSRALLRPQFARDQINDLELIERHCQQLFCAIDRVAGSGGGTNWTVEFDLQPLFYNMALDITTELIYGYSVHLQNPSKRVKLPSLPGYGTPDREKIGMHMDAGKAWVETRGALWKYRWLLPTKQFHTHCDAVHKYAEYFVILRLQRGDAYLSDLDNSTSRGRYVFLHELAKLTQDPVELRSQTLNVLTAGRDTTAALMGWVFYFLARHPDVYLKLRAQVLDVFGRFDASAPAKLGFKDLRDRIPYATCVINEVLRMAPVIPLNERVALRDTVLPRGGGPSGSEPVFVPKDRQVLIAAYAMTRRKDLWGEDVDVFRPERWEEDGGRKFGFEFIPFGGGARQCLGRRFLPPFLLTPLSLLLSLLKHLSSLPVFSFTPRIFPPQHFRSLLSIRSRMRSNCPQNNSPGPLPPT